MAKKFKFRLAQVLQFRNLARDEKKKILADKNRRLRGAEDRLQELETACASCQSPEGLQANASFEIESLFLHRVIDEIEKQKVVIQELVLEVNTARIEYLEAHKDVEMLEKLKEKQTAEYMEHVSHEEAKFLDELAVQRAGKTQS